MMSESNRRVMLRVMLSTLLGLPFYSPTVLLAVFYSFGIILLSFLRSWLLCRRFSCWFLAVLTKKQHSNQCDPLSSRSNPSRSGSGSWLPFFAVSKSWAVATLRLLETQGQPYKFMLTIGGKARALKMPLHMQCVYLIKLEQQYWLGIPTGHIIALVVKSSRFQRCNEIWNGPQFPATKCDHQPGKKDNAIIIQSIRPCRFLQDFEYTKPHSY